jgi:LysM repeat protein
MAANDLASANRIQMGTQLVIPGGGTPQMHVVQRGETLIAIAARYGRPLEALVAATDLRSPDRLRVGMALSIPASN